MQTIPGIEPISAAMILIEIGDDLSVFAHTKYLASWAALCPGNHTLRYGFCEAAHVAHEKRTARELSEEPGGATGAQIIAVAHPVLRTI